MYRRNYEKILKYWDKKEESIKKWKEKISEMHYEYYCEYFGIHPKDYYNFCITSQHKPEEIIEHIKKVQLNMREPLVGFMKI